MVPDSSRLGRDLRSFSDKNNLVGYIQQTVGNNQSHKNFEFEVKKDIPQTIFTSSISCNTQRIRIKLKFSQALKTPKEYGHSQDGASMARPCSPGRTARNRPGATAWPSPKRTGQGFARGSLEPQSKLVHNTTQSRILSNSSWSAKDN